MSHKTKAKTFTQNPLSVPIPRSINFHLTNACNYRCRFCFAQYGEHSSPLSVKKAKTLIDLLVEDGCTKLNFAGGEPTLVPYLAELINYTHSHGIFVSLISNGTGITEEFLDSCGASLDLIGLSIDSAHKQCEIQLGRTLKACLRATDYSHVQQVLTVAKLIHHSHIPLKINTTITALNYQEDMHDLIATLNPTRWKVFQVRQVKQVNDAFFADELGITERQFYTFIDRHKDLQPVYETAKIMADSYCMITPDGRFYYSSNGTYRYSEKLLDIGLTQALTQINFNPVHFFTRNGQYYEQFSNPSQVQSHSDTITLLGGELD